MQALQLLAPALQNLGRQPNEVDSRVELRQAAQATIEHVDQLLGDPANICTRCRFIKQDHYERCARCGHSLYEGPAEVSATRARQSDATNTADCRSSSAQSATSCPCNKPRTEISR
jgi:hypothetical protein